MRCDTRVIAGRLSARARTAVHSAKEQKMHFSRLNSTRLGLLKNHHFPFAFNNNNNNNQPSSHFSTVQSCLIKIVRGKRLEEKSLSHHLLRKRIHNNEQVDGELLPHLHLLNIILIHSLFPWTSKVDALTVTPTVWFAIGSSCLIIMINSAFLSCVLQLLL